MYNTFTFRPTIYAHKDSAVDRVLVTLEAVPCVERNVLADITFQIRIYVENPSAWYYVFLSLCSETVESK